MKGTLLIVEDEAEVLGVMADYLTAVGYRVHTAASGQEALGRIATIAAPFDLAVIDWTLPDMSGGDVLQVLRERRPDCRVIVTTGHLADLVDDLLPSDLTGNIMRKPFALRALALRVEMLLESARNTI